MSAIRAAAKKLFRHLGYEVWRIDNNALGLNPLTDIKKLNTCPAPLVLDVGANIGTSVADFQDIFPNAEIHSFEPSPTTFKTLEANTRGRKNVFLNNVAVGSSKSTMTFYENESAGMSSFLKPTELAWGKVINELPIPIITLDDYCESKKIPRVHALKVDVQGFELEVFKGAQSLMAANRIQMLLMEVIFSEQYEKIPPFDTVCRFLMDRNFKLVSFYRFYHQRNLASFSDALFFNPEFKAT